MNQYHARLRLSAYQPARVDDTAVFLLYTGADYNRLVASFNALGIVPETCEGTMFYSAKVDWQEWQSI